MTPSPCFSLTITREKLNIEDIPEHCKNIKICEQSPDFYKAEIICKHKNINYTAYFSRNNFIEGIIFNGSTTPILKIRCNLSSFVDTAIVINYDDSFTENPEILSMIDWGFQRIFYSDSSNFEITIWNKIDVNFKISDIFTSSVGGFTICDINIYVTYEMCTLYKDSFYIIIENDHNEPWSIDNIGLYSVGLETFVSDPLIRTGCTEFKEYFEGKEKIRISNIFEFLLPSLSVKHMTESQEVKFPSYELKGAWDAKK